MLSFYLSSVGIIVLPGHSEIKAHQEKTRSFQCIFFSIDQSGRPLSGDKFPGHVAREPSLQTSRA